MHRIANNRSLRRLPLVLFAVLTLGLFSSDALAQRGFQSDPVDNSPQLKRAGSIVRNWVKRPNSDPAQVKQFEDYFDRYYFPLMTQTTPEDLSNLGKLRADLFRQYIDPAAPQIRRQLTQKAYEFSNRIIQRKSPQGQPRRYHRSVQYNALLILGSLTTDGTKPFPAANNFLCLVADRAVEKRLPAFMLAASLVKLSEHAEQLDTLPSANQARTLRTLASATAAGAADPSADALAQDWLRRRAAMAMMAGAKKVGRAPAAAAPLVGLVADKSLTLESRAAIAGSLQEVQLPPTAAKAMLDLAGEVSQAELEEAKAFEELRIEGTGRRGSNTSKDSKRYRFNAADSRVEYVREGLATQLTHLKRGLEAAQASAGDQAADVQAAIQAIDGVLRVATNSDSIDLDISAAVKSMAQEISSLSSPPAEQPATDAVDDLLG